MRHRLVFLATAATVAVAVASPTRVVDTMRAANNQPANGTCVLTWPSFRTADGVSVSSGTRRYLVRGGVVDIALQPTVGGIPTSSPWLAPAYVVTCYLGAAAPVTEYWQVPTTSPATLAQVRQGPPGVAGGGGSGMVRFSDHELPVGVIDGLNHIFTTALTPNPPVSLHVWRNGILLRSSVDYTASGNVITFLSCCVPQAGDLLEVSYRY